MDNFERLMALAEFGANRHNERRQVEFRIFISYTTLLALILYHATASGGLFGLLPNMWNDRDNWLPTIPLLIAHGFYCLWQRGLSVAMANDAYRRNFFLAKAECIVHHFIKYPYSETFRPGQNRKVRVVFGPDNGCERSEKELFEIPHPDILILPLSWKDFLKHWDKIWKDWARRLQLAIPTIMLGTLFLLKLNFWWQGLLTLAPLAILSVFLPLVSFCCTKRKRNDNPRIPKPDRGNLLRTRR